MKLQTKDKKKLRKLHFTFDLLITCEGKIFTQTRGGQLDYVDVLRILRAHKNGFENRLKDLSTKLEEEEKKKKDEAKKDYKIEQLPIDPNYKL